MLVRVISFNPLNYSLNNSISSYCGEKVKLKMSRTFPKVTHYGETGLWFSAGAGQSHRVLWELRSGDWKFMGKEGWSGFLQKEAELRDGSKMSKTFNRGQTLGSQTQCFSNCLCCGKETESLPTPVHHRPMFLGFLVKHNKNKIRETKFKN